MIKLSLKKGVILDLVYKTIWPCTCKKLMHVALILPRVHNFIGEGEYPTLYTAAKHTALSYDAIRY